MLLKFPLAHAIFRASTISYLGHAEIDVSFWNIKGIWVIFHRWLSLISNMWQTIMDRFLLWCSTICHARTCTCEIAIWCFFPCIHFLKIEQVSMVIVVFSWLCWKVLFSNGSFRRIFPCNRSFVVVYVIVKYKTEVLTGISKSKMLGTWKCRQSQKSRIWRYFWISFSKVLVPGNISKY